MQMKALRHLKPVLLLLALIALVGLVFFRPSTRPRSAHDLADRKPGTDSRHDQQDGVPKAGARATGNAASSSSRPKGVSGGPEVDLSEQLKLILGDDSKLTSLERIERLRARDFRFNDSEVAEIFAYLQSGRMPSGLSAEAWHWIVDQLFTTIRIGTSQPSEVAVQMDKIFANSNLDPVIRDYALQHLGHLGGEGADPEIVRGAATQGLGEPNGSIAGTGLLVLHNQPASADPGRNPGELALALLGSDKASSASKTTALTVATRHKTAGTLEAAIGQVQGEQPLHLKLAAVATIAELGDAGDIPILEGMGENPNPHFQRVLQAAIRKLSAPQESSQSIKPPSQ